MTTTILNDHIELGQMEEADMSLSLMAMPKETTSNLLTPLMRRRSFLPYEFK
jgi:hypothetical protein